MTSIGGKMASQWKSPERYVDKIMLNMWLYLCH